jgi:hypothetical protein
MTLALGTYGLLSAAQSYIASRKRKAELDGLIAKLKDSMIEDEEPEEKP